MDCTYRLTKFVVVCFLFLLFSKEGAALTWTIQPTSATGIQGQSVTITWTADLDGGETWTNVRVSQDTGQVNKIPMILKQKDGRRLVFDDYSSRDADLNLTASLNGTLLTSVFTMKNLNRSTDEHLYDLRIGFSYTNGITDSRGSADMQLTVFVSPIITSPASSPTSVTANETQTAQLVCTATGHPTPSINWTRDGVIVGTGSPFTTPAVNFTDDKACYTCVAYNGVLDAKTANVCLNVQFSPRNTPSLVSSKTLVCQNDKVSLTCTSGPANPPPDTYKFFNNDSSIGSSASNVYEATATAGLPDVNKFVCVPRNILGDALENASVVVKAKVPPVIVTSPQATTTLVEKSTLTLFCNASGVPTPNITWTKADGSVVGNTRTLTISGILRGQEGTYRCTASNGDECSNVTADTNVVVNYKPENTSLTASRTTGCVSDSLTLTCNTSAKPAPSKYRFFRNDVLIKPQSTKTYTFPLSVSGANVYKCQPENMAGNGTDSNVTVTVKAAPVIDFVTPSQELIEGNSLTLVCNVTDSSGQLNVSWHKVGGDQLSSNSTYTIASVGRNDAGSYQCKAHNGNECDAKTKLVDVTVKYPAAITNHSSLAVKANENDMVTLECNVSGSPTPKVNWTRNGQQITGKHGQTYSFNAMESLSGNYSCVVSNGVGDVQRKTFDVKITGYCKNHKCRYGGTCRSKGVGYRCLCTRGLIGKFCEFEDPITSEFDCLLVIVNPDWVPEYGNKKSSKHNELENEICDKMFMIFNGFNGRPPAIPGRNLVTCALLDTRQGSIISNTLLTFNGSVLRSEVLNAIQDSVVNETIFGNLTLKASSIQIEPKRDPCSSEPCKFDGNCEVQGNGYRCECGSFRYGMHCEKGIGLIPGLIIILACILIIIIIIILCVLYCKRKKSETYPSAGAENGTQMKTYTLSDHNAAAANPHVITADEKPPVRNGQPVETYRQQNTDEKPNQDATLEEEAIELTEKDSNPEPEKQTEVGDQDEGSKQTDNVADSQGGDETPENPKTDGYSTSILVRLV